MNDFIRADRTGDWKLHVHCLKKLQPILQVMDRTNYAKWAALYLEDMIMLEKNYPEVYEQFLKGRFTVKQSTTPYTSVATDQALEQLINRPSKGTGGIIGITKKKESVAVWNLTFHELLTVTSYLNKIIFINDYNEELLIHHEYSLSTTENSELAVDSILTFFKNKKNRA